MKLFRFTPITEKRLQRFRKSRVAFCSLWLILSLGLISLLAPLLCNDKPLYLRYNGASYLPFLHKTPPKAIIEAAGTAQVDYKDFTQSPAFTATPGNRALFAPIPYGPGEVLETEALETEKKVTLTLRPILPIARFDLTQDGRIVRPVACERFFIDTNLATHTHPLEDYWQLDAPTRAQIARRFAGEPTEAHTATLTAVPGSRARPQTLSLRLPATQKAIYPVKTVRISISDAYDPTLHPLQIHFRKTPGGPPRPLDKKTWATFTPAQQATFTAWVTRAFEKDLISTEIPYKGATAQAITTVQTITWPFPPTAGHWMGIDAAGRDVAARILYGMRISLSFGFLLAVWATLIGMIYGSIQGYFAGKTDIALQRFVEIWSALPFLYIMVLVGDLFGRQFGVLLLCYGIFNWIALSLYMRGEFLRLRNRPFVDAARCQGLSHIRIIFRHILPNALTPMITLFPFTLVGAISSLTALDFLGFGLPPLTPSWGELLQQAHQYRWAWWLILFPASALFTVMFLTVLVGEGVRNAFDPKPYSKME